MRSKPYLVCSSYTTTLSFYLIFLLIPSFFAQANCQEIFGRVTDQNHTPLAYVTIQLKVKDSLIKATVSDTLGYFVFYDIQPGVPYSFSFSRVGYPKLDTIADGVHNLFVLKHAQNELKEVTVLGKPLIERQIDRLVFNVDGNVNTMGLDALEVLAKTPLVRVRNDVPSIIGDVRQAEVSGLGLSS
jgi:iron complex outermembrane receptor protein